MSSTSFTARKLSWLETVARTRTLPRSALALAVVLATRYFNSASGEAWPAERTLARDLGMARASVQVGILKLVAAGLLRKVSGGPHATNHYAIPRRWSAAVRPSGQGLSGLAGKASPGPARKASEAQRARPEPGKEPERRTRDRTPRARRRGQGVSSRRSRATMFPSEWTCGAAELKAAANSSARWQAERALAEFKRFARWHLDHATRSTDWTESWSTWCERGAEIDARSRERTAVRKDRSRAGVVGVARWFEDQRQAASYVAPGKEDDA